MIRFLAIGCALALCGCAPDLTALANDHNAICVKVTSVWSTVTIDRNWGCEMPAAPVAAAP